MKVKEIAEIFGGQRKLAKILNIDHGTISKSISKDNDLRAKYIEPILQELTKKITIYRDAEKKLKKEKKNL